MKLFVDLNQWTWLKETAENKKRAIRHLVSWFYTSFLCDKKLFVIGEFNFDSNVNIAVWLIEEKCNKK